MLVLTRRLEESIVITVGSDRVIVKLIELRGDKVRLGIIAPKHIIVHRAEAQRDIDTNGLREKANAPHE